MPLYWEEKTLLFKLETTYGVDSAPTGAVNAILATDVSITPMEGQDTSRNLELPYKGAQSTVPTNVYSKITFKVELKGSGAAGTPPVVGPLLQACSMAEVIVATTSVTYSRVSKGEKSATIKLNIAGKLYQLLGSRGKVVERAVGESILYLEFEFWGLFVLPSAQALPAVTIASQITAFPDIANTENTPVMTIGGDPYFVRSWVLDFGNALETRFLLNKREIVIPRISESLQTTIEAVPVGTLNPEDLAMKRKTRAIIYQHGTAAGKIVTHNLPLCQAMRPGPPTQQQGIVEQQLNWVPLPNTGNDQLTIAFT